MPTCAERAELLIEAGIPVHGAEKTVALVEEHGEDSRAPTLEFLKAPRHRTYREAHAKLPFIAPTHLFRLADGKTIRAGDETVEVYFPGPSHTPDKEVLFGGCMIMADDRIGNTSDADMAAWPDSVRKLSRFDFDVVVPGHGDRSDPGLIEHTLNLLAGSR